MITSITAVSPAESAGTVDITVQTEVGTSATSSSDQFTFGSPQYFAGPPKSGGKPAANLTMSQLQPVIRQAVVDLRAAGYDVTPFAQVTFHITDLGAPLLGLTSGNNIWIDKNADGYGWYRGLADAAFKQSVSSTESAALPTSPAAGHVDLLTVVMHELGHVLGFASIDPSVLGEDWMTATLGTGIRRLPDPNPAASAAPPALSAPPSALHTAFTAPSFSPAAHAAAFTWDGEPGLEGESSLAAPVLAGKGRRRL